MNKQAFWSVENVKTFRGHDVVNGQIDVSDDAYGDYIDEIYPTVEVAGMSFNPSRIIQECDPVAWRCGMGDWESQLQAELEDQLSNEDSDEIEFIDEDELDDEED